MAARAAMPTLQIHAIDPDPQARAIAQTLKTNHAKIFNQPVFNTVTDDLAQALKSGVLAPENRASHLVLIACHLAQSRLVLEQLAAELTQTTTDATLNCAHTTPASSTSSESPICALPYEGLVITDIGSCKRQICELGQSILPCVFIGGHPLAGRERSGLDWAQSTLFEGKPWLLCPHEATPAPVQDALEAFINTLGASRILRMSPQKHDQAMAMISHFPQLYSTLLANLLEGISGQFSEPFEPHELLQFQGTGIAGHLRLAASPYAMWGQIMQENAPNVRQVLQAWRALTEQAMAALDAQSTDVPVMAQPDDKLDALTGPNTLNGWFNRANELYDSYLSHQAQTGIKEPQVEG